MTFILAISCFIQCRVHPALLYYFGKEEKYMKNCIVYKPGDQQRSQFKEVSHEPDHFST